MYNCEVCGTGCGPGLPLRKHTLYRARQSDGCQEIHQELAVCDGCQTLATFTPITILIRQKGNVRKSVAHPPVEVVPVVKNEAPLKPGEAEKKLTKNPRLVYRK